VLNFSYALLLFTAILTFVYLLLMIISSSKIEKERICEGEQRNVSSRVIIFVAYLLAGLQTFVGYLWKDSLIYLLLFPVITLLLLILISRASAYKTHVIGLTVYLHLLVLSLISLPSGVFITETTPASVMLDRTGVWNPVWNLLNPYYNPFPMQQGLYCVFSKITGINYVSYVFSWLIDLFFVIAYDLTLFTISKRLSGNWRIGCLSVILLSFTPSLVINPQPQWLANLFILVFMLGLFKALKDTPSFSSIVLVNLSYATAILLHGTAAIGMVVVSVLLILMFFGRKFGVNIATTAHHRSFVYVVSISVYVMTLGRWVVLGGITSVISPLRGLVNDILGYGEVSGVSAQYVPLYNQFVSPIIAYAWSVPISLAIAFLLYHFVNRVQKKTLNVVFLSSLSVAAAGLAFGGLVGSVFVANANLQRYLGYAGMALFIPVAAVVGIKIIQSLSWKIVGIGLISIVLFSGIGVCDPAFSPQLYREIKTVNPTSSADLIEGKTLYGILSERTYVVSTYEVLTALWYLSIVPESSGKSIRFYASSLKTHRIMIDKLMYEKEVASGITYIWSPEILSVANETLANVVYNSGRHVAVGRGG